TSRCAASGKSQRTWSAIDGSRSVRGRAEIVVIPLESRTSLTARPKPSAARVTLRPNERPSDRSACALPPPSATVPNSDGTSTVRWRSPSTLRPIRADGPTCSTSAASPTCGTTRFPAARDSAPTNTPTHADDERCGGDEGAGAGARTVAEGAGGSGAGG